MQPVKPHSCGSFPIGKGSEFTSGADGPNQRFFRRWIRWQGREGLHFARMDVRPGTLFEDRVLK